MHEVTADWSQKEDASRVDFKREKKKERLRTLKSKSLRRIKKRSKRGDQVARRYHGLSRRHSDTGTQHSDSGRRMHARERVSEETYARAPYPPFPCSS